MIAESERDKIIIELLGLEDAWPLIDVLKKLMEGTEILLYKKDYDAHGWEDFQGCVVRAKDIITKLESLQNEVYKLK